MNGRWDDYVISLGGPDDPPEPLWRAAAGNVSGRSMFVLGVGFDPRSLVALRRFLELDHDRKPIVGYVELPPPSPASGPGARAGAQSNQAEFLDVVEDIETRRVDHQEVFSPSNAGPRVAREATKPEFVADVDHLIVDISSLPARLYFPLIAATLQAVDRGIPGFPSEVQVVACENPAVDAAIKRLGVSEAAIVGGFRGSLEHESDPTGTVIWAPVLGEGAEDALVAIHDLLQPGDVCPVLPFPARNPRRADDLMLETQVQLFDTFLVTPGNIIYADERNPFDLYRTLSLLQNKYRLALKALEPTTIALSTHSSKLLSLGALLAAYEHDLPIVAAPALDYELEDLEPEVADQNRVACAWLAGLPYSVAVSP